MKSCQTIRKNATGETLTMLVSEEDNDGEYQLYEVQLPSRQSGPPLHYHVDFAETFTVNEGKLDIYLGKTRSTCYCRRETTRRLKSSSRTNLPTITMSQ
jgi:hypothetical protein